MVLSALHSCKKYVLIFIAGTEARRVYDDAQVMLKRIVDERWLRAAASVAFYPVAADGDDILVYSADTPKGAIFSTFS